jgi:hypothetical protein
VRVRVRVRVRRELDPEGRVLSQGQASNQAGVTFFYVANTSCRAGCRYIFELAVALFVFLHQQN